MRILVTRPLPGGAATAARLERLGHTALLTPLLKLEAVAWEPPAKAPQAVMVTSAAAVQLAGAGTAVFRALPLYAVGAATASAARAAGFVDVRSGEAGVQALIEAMAGEGITTALHLAGEDRTAVRLPAGLTLTIRIVYRARLQPLLAMRPVDWVLLYSARTAAHFASEIDRLAVARGGVSVAAISDAALAAAGTGWKRAVAAASPDEDALLAAIGVAWQKPHSNL
jgi:uroporphyrinogen-III synthase